MTDDYGYHPTKPLTGPPSQRAYREERPNLSDMQIQRISDRIVNYIASSHPLAFNTVRDIERVVLTALKEESHPVFRFTVEVRATNEFEASQQLGKLIDPRSDMRMMVGDPGSHRVEDDHD